MPNKKEINTIIQGIEDSLETATAEDEAEIARLKIKSQPDEA